MCLDHILLPKHTFIYLFVCLIISFSLFDIKILRKLIRKKKQIVFNKATSTNRVSFEIIKAYMLPCIRQVPRKYTSSLTPKLLFLVYVIVTYTNNNKKSTLSMKRASLTQTFLSFSRHFYSMLLEQNGCRYMLMKLIFCFTGQEIIFLSVYPPSLYCNIFVEILNKVFS